MKVFYTCKHCGHEIEVRVVIDEEDDLAERCEECDAVIPDIAHEQVQELAMQSYPDHLEDEE